MSYHFRYTFLKLHARILRKILTMISFAGIFASCHGIINRQTSSNQDSLKQTQLSHQQDSIAKLKADSLLQAKQDSIARAVQPVIPTVVPPEAPVCDYGVISYPIEQPIQTLYGAPSIVNPND